MVFSFKCTPNTSTICNAIALIFGIVHFFIFLKSYLIKKQSVTFIGLLISAYMILSHIITINPYTRTFIDVYYKLELPIFEIKSYLLLLSHSFHETKLTNEIQKLQSEINNKSIIDAGAYIGDTSVFLAKHYPNQKIYAIEPSENNCNFMENVKEKNNLNNLFIYNSLLSDKITDYSTKNVNEPNAVYSESNNSACSSSLVLQSTTIDTLVDSNIIMGPVGLLHFDVEGMELEVLKGSAHTIITHKPIIIVETLGKSNKNDDLQNYLQRLGYYKYITVNESCSVSDFCDSKLCRNHIYKPIVRN